MRQPAHLRCDQRAAATAALLWSACRPDPDHVSAEEARLAGADLDSASQVAITQRVSALLWRVVRSWATEDDRWSSPLHDDSARAKAQALLVRPQVGRLLLEPLARAGLRPMVIKGLALADRYPEPSLRPMDDVDLLMRADEHREAADILRRAGWQATRRQGPKYSRSLSHAAMPGLPVDLHCDLAVRAEQVFRFNAKDLWDAPQAGTLFGVEVFMPSPEAELLLLATHAGKPYHNFDRMLWAVDAAVVIRAAGSGATPIDWDRLGELSKKAAAGSALAVLLSQAMRFGAASPSRMRTVEAGSVRGRALEPARSAVWPVEQLTPALRGRLTYAVIDDPWLRTRRLFYDAQDDGLIRAPFRAVMLIWRILRRSWRLRGTAGVSRLTDGSAEHGDEKVGPVVPHREP